MEIVSGTPERRILNSWKQIAAHLGLGVRTVQRYESQYGMPIRRFSRRSRSSVAGFTDEIDAWIEASTTRSVLVPKEEWERLVKSVEILQRELKELQKQKNAPQRQVPREDQMRRSPDIENRASNAA